VAPPPCRLAARIVPERPSTIFLTMAWTLALVLTVLGSFCFDLPLRMADIDVFSFVIQAGVLAMAMLATRRHAVSEREAKEALEDQRASLKRLETQLEGVTLQEDKMVHLGELTTSIAHDLNSPIAVIMGYSDLLQGDPSSPAKVAEDARRIG